VSEAMQDLRMTCSMPGEIKGEVLGEMTTKCD